MNKFLSHDAATGELRLVYTDLWRGQHERTEYRVIDQPGGDGVRNRPELDGKPVLGTVPPLFARIGPFGAELWIWTDERPAETVKTPCPKATNARRKCGLCV